MGAYEVPTKHYIGTTNYCTYGYLLRTLSFLLSILILTDTYNCIGPVHSTGPSLVIVKKVEENDTLSLMLK